MGWEMIEPVRSLVSRVRNGRQPPVVYECRRCGQTLQAEDDECPYCSTTEVCAYVIG